MSEPKRILFLMTDQQRWDTIHALGCENAITPNLDRLAAEAAVFENCYTPAPVCAPARLSLYSGLYPAGHGSCNNSPDIVYTGDGLYGMLTAGGFDDYITHSCVQPFFCRQFSLPPVSQLSNSAAPCFSSAFWTFLTSRARGVTLLNAASAAAVPAACPVARHTPPMR